MAGSLPTSIQMPALESITMDGITYKVKVLYDSMSLRFALIPGANAGTMMSGRKIYALLGTEYGHKLTVQPDPTHRDDFDAFIHAISAPVDNHRIALPYGQGLIEYDAHVTSGEVTYKGHMGGRNIWGGAEIYYEPIEPQRLPDDDEGDW